MNESFGTIKYRINYKPPEVIASRIANMDYTIRTPYFIIANRKKYKKLKYNQSILKMNRLRKLKNDRNRNPNIKMG